MFSALELAKKVSGSKNNLNALCRRFNSVESREKHGALTDCYLLLRVYIELMGVNKSIYYSIQFKRKPNTRKKLIMGTEKKLLLMFQMKKKMHQKMLEKYQIQFRFLIPYLYLLQKKITTYSICGKTHLGLKTLIFRRFVRLSTGLESKNNLF